MSKIFFRKIAIVVLLFSSSLLSKGEGCYQKEPPMEVGNPSPVVRQEQDNLTLTFKNLSGIERPVCLDGDVEESPEDHLCGEMMKVMEALKQFLFLNEHEITFNEYGLTLVRDGEQSCSATSVKSVFQVSCAETQQRTHGDWQDDFRLLVAKKDSSTQEHFSPADDAWKEYQQAWNDDQENTFQAQQANRHLALFQTKKAEVERALNLVIDATDATVEWVRVFTPSSPAPQKAREAWNKAKEAWSALNLDALNHRKITEISHKIDEAIAAAQTMVNTPFQYGQSASSEEMGQFIKRIAMTATNPLLRTLSQIGIHGFADPLVSAVKECGGMVDMASQQVASTPNTVPQFIREVISQLQGKTREHINLITTKLLQERVHELQQQYEVKTAALDEGLANADNKEGIAQKQEEELQEGYSVVSQESAQIALQEASQRDFSHAVKKLWEHVARRSELAAQVVNEKALVHQEDVKRGVSTAEEEKGHAAKKVEEARGTMETANRNYTKALDRKEQLLQQQSQARPGWNEVTQQEKRQIYRNVEKAKKEVAVAQERFNKAQADLEIAEKKVVEAKKRKEPVELASAQMIARAGAIAASDGSTLMIVDWPQLTPHPPLGKLHNTGRNAALLHKRYVK